MNSARPLCFAVLAVVGGCTKTPLWTQFHGDGANAGYASVRSQTDLGIPKRVFVGDVATSSPVLAQGGKIYVATLQGAVVGVTTAGQIFANKVVEVGATIVAAPAFGQDGNVYVVATRKLDDGNRVSTLYTLSGADLSAIRAFPFPHGSYSTAAPKTIRTPDGVKVILAVRGPSPLENEVIVLDAQGGRDAVSIPVKCPTDITGGVSDFAEGFLGYVTGGLYTLKDYPFHVEPLDPTELLIWPHPTPAFVTRGDGHVTIVVATNGCALSAFDWDDTRHVLAEIWVHTDTHAYYSSPAISLNGHVLVGRNDGHVKSYRLTDGLEEWDFPGPNPIQASAALLIEGNSATYVMAYKHLLVLDSGGNLTDQLDMPSVTLASPALSLSRLYISTPAGFSSLSFDLKEAHTDTKAAGGASSPAIGLDGSIYAISGDGFLNIYAGPP
jgi:outer membrane protein assembly factor BamB